MNRPIEQALTSLLPSWTGPLPDDLVALAHSLLAQSRSQAGTLRAEEEIARTYACANIACEKLKLRLNLPKIEPRPPVPPRVYKKVFNYLSTALASVKAGQDTTTGTPRGSRARNPPSQAREAATPTRSRLAVRGTPKADAASPATSSDRARPAPADPTAVDPDLPPWAVAMVRRLCNAFDLPAAAPHVFAGLESILATAREAATPGRRRSRRRKDEPEPLDVTPEAVPALAVAILLYTMTKLTGETISGEEYLTKRTRAVAVIAESDMTPTKPETDRFAEIDWFLRRAQTDGWLDMEWYQNIEEPEVEEDGDVVMEGGDDEPARIANGGGITGPSVGSILSMHDAVDWLSEERMREYQHWEKRMMDRIAEIEREGRVGAANG